MKYLSILFAILFFSFAAYGQTQCSVTLSTYNTSIIADGGSPEARRATIDVFAPAACSWTATVNQFWTTFDALGQNRTVSGTGNGQVTIYTGFNNTDPRTGTITVNDKTITVNQGSTCQYSLVNGDLPDRFTGAGGTKNYRSIRYGFSGSCTVTHTTQTSWIRLGATSYTVDPNESTARTGYITYHYGSQRTLTLVVEQESGCVYSLSSNAADRTGNADGGTFDIRSVAPCSWTAAAQNDWITITRNAAGTGNGTIGYSVSANTSGSPRTGTINAGGQIFTVNQAGASCKFTLSQASVDIPSASAPGNVTLGSDSSCAWTAVSNAEWLTLNGITSGTSGAIIDYVAAANTSGTARTGTITAGGQTFTVNQAAGVSKSRKRVRIF
jgi:hypothetical protein